MKPLLRLPAAMSLPQSAILKAIQGIIVDATGDGGAQQMAAEANLDAADTCPLFAWIGPVEKLKESDLNALLAFRIGGVVLAGCRGPADVQKLDVMLRVAEAATGIHPGSAAILAEYATTAESVLSPHSLLGVSSRLSALIFDSSALAGATGSRTPSGLPGDDTAVIIAGRAAAVLRAREAGIAAYDMLPATAVEEATIRQSCATSLENGFSAVIARSPRQIPFLGV